MKAEDATLGLDGFDFRGDHGRILMVAVAHPDLQDAKPLFGRDGDAGEGLNEGVMATHDIAHDGVRHFAPGVGHRFVGHFVRKIATHDVLRVFVARRNSLAHEEQHAIFDEIGRQRFHQGNRLFHRVHSGDAHVAFHVPLRVVRQMCPQHPPV